MLYPQHSFLNILFHPPLGASSSGSRGWDIGVVCPCRACEFIPSLTGDVYGHLTETEKVIRTFFRLFNFSVQRT